MNIVTISGSSRADSSNSKLLDHLSDLDLSHSFHRTELHFDLPVFRAELDCNPLSQVVKMWRMLIVDSDAVIISVPEYIHNMPAVIKNALEWLTSSGELNSKRVLPISFTPNEPRGEKALQSLVWSLQALESNIVVKLPLFHNQINYTPKLSGEGAEMLKEAIMMI